MKNGHVRIGEVARRTGLSLRTIRYYEEVGLVVPSARTPGGFRLYTDADIERLQVVRRMKPLEFSLEQMRDLLDLLKSLDQRRGGTRRQRERVAVYRDAVESRCQTLRDQLAAAEQLAGDLNVRLSALTRPSARAR